MLTLDLSGMTLAMVDAGVNQAANNLNEYFGWTTTSEQNFWQSIITSSAFVGASIGSLFGGKLIMYGRRPVIICSLIGSIVGTFLCCISNPIVVIFGRLATGFF